MLKTLLWEKYFCSFLQCKDVKFGSFVSCSHVWFWKEKCNGRQFSNKKFNCEWNFQLPFFQLVNFWTEFFFKFQILKQQSKMHQVFNFHWFFGIKRCSKFTFQKIFSNLRRWNVKIGFFVLSWKGLFSEKKNMVDNFFSKTFWKGVRFGIRLLHPCKFWKKFCK